MDTNHRGGSPGFLRVADEGGQSPNHTALTLVYPEFSGNRLYQTLGNLKVNPLVGVVIPDFETGNVWQAGQYITLDFGTELDLGWSHMRDDDPQSLNDDFGPPPYKFGNT
ncbi:hypothetical protein HMPREF1624_06726 [Sporothrix schenckii ATCC 58251]|uniref:Pyridoxamine 5'-phosphate oxidase putative domain-containing protein n=1 Tax=Sporothrix schenckii (strain ATCC 58251 / de Perez 2211183) TaxID=1391915 RepID=U7PLT1_SPOS1|nr:hypothetical protein HMPREF1624_06726 [Sporothrix schenckii ATCC 58251]